MTARLAPTQEGLNPSPTQIVERAIAYLASQCDGASDRDGVGFNGVDSGFGHSLAQRIRDGLHLTPGQVRAAVKMLKKYSKQLKAIGLKVPNLKDLEEVISFTQLDEYNWHCKNETKETEYELATDGEKTILACTCTAFTFKNWCDHCDRLSTVLNESCPETRGVKPGGDALQSPDRPNSTASLLVYGVTKSDAVEATSDAVSDAVTIVEQMFEAIRPKNAENFSESFSEKNDVSQVETDPLENGLSDQQVLAFRAIRKWFDEGGNEPFVLKGFAGVGKTFSIQRIIQSLKRDRPSLRVAFCAPTHKARSVLDSMANDAGLRVEIATVHGICHLYPGSYTKDGKPKIDINPWSKEPYYADFDLVVIDECSMLGDELLKFIPFKGNRQVQIPPKKKTVARFVPTIFMGDTAQLPPVSNMDDEENEVALDQSPVFAFPGFQLTQVMRYDGAIARYVTELRNDLNRMYPPRLETEGNITRMSAEEWGLELIKEFCEIDILHEPNRVRALAWTNKRVETINKAIRSALFPGVTDTYVKGERVMAKEPIMKQEVYDGRTYKKAAMYSCAEATIKESQPKEFELPIPWLLHEMYEGCDFIEASGYSLVLRKDTQEEITQNAIAPSDFNKVRILVKEWKEAILSIEPADDRKHEWREFYTFLEDYALIYKGKSLLNRLQYAYALTIHQSQGSTFENVFIDLSNVMGCRDTLTRNKLLYTGFTRASKQLNVLSKY